MKKETAPQQRALEPLRRQMKSTTPPKKWRILKVLTERSLNRFEAEFEGDHCLHSTVSEIEHSLGLEVSREWEWVPTRFPGVCAKVKRYYLAGDSIAGASRLLGNKASQTALTGLGAPL